MLDFNIQYIEQPLAAWDMDNLRRLRNRSKSPICADESIFDHHDAFKFAALGAVDYFNIKLGKSGGIHGALKINAIAEINKRKHTPDEVSSYMKELKQSMQKALSLVNDVTQLPTFDAEKHLRVLPTIGPIKAGKYFYSKLYRVLVFDDVRLSRFSVLSGRVNVNNGLLREHGFCPSEYRDLNDDCLERSLQQCGKSLAGDKKQDAFCLLKMRTA